MKAMEVEIRPTVADAGLQEAVSRAAEGLHKRTTLVVNLLLFAFRGK
jgi:hypothetical protein